MKAQTRNKRSFWEILAESGLEGCTTSWKKLNKVKTGLKN